MVECVLYVLPVSLIVINVVVQQFVPFVNLHGFYNFFILNSKIKIVILNKKVFIYR